VTCLLKAGIAEQEGLAVARERLCKHGFTATNSTAATDTRNNRAAVGGGVLCWVCAEAIRVRIKRYNSSFHARLILGSGQAYDRSAD
jgi:hypothetical protein